jgi:peptidylprolyl isomerase
MRRATILAVLALTLAACGGSGGADTTTDTGPAPGPDGETTVASTSPAPVTEGIAASGDVVAVEYVGTLTDGTQFDSSEEHGEPLTFTIDDGSMIPGFNDAVAGMEVGETKTVTIPVEDAYGPRQEDAIIEVPLDQLPEGVAAGDQLVSPTQQVVTVVEVGDEFATIDTNHFLAGEDLIFEITLVSRIPAEG